MAAVREVKRTLDGREQAFAVEPLILSARLAVVRFRLAQDRSVSGFHFPAGSTTLGYFWAHRHYLLYRFCGPDGGLIAHRFDIIDRAHIRTTRIDYRDLAVDVWVAADNRFFVEDEDELAAYAAAGKVSERELAIVGRTLRLLRARHHRIIAEAEALTRTLAVPCERAGPGA
jgi:hypothetical protein